MYEKKTVAEPANSPFTPKEKYLETQEMHQSNAGGM